jgi:hypothetical protein
MARENREKRNAAALGRGFVEWSVDPFENGTTEQPEPQHTGARRMIRL